MRARIWPPVGHVVKMTFMAQNRDGQVIPAYARFIAIPGSNFFLTPGAPPATTARVTRQFEPGSDFLAGWATTRSTNFGRTSSTSYFIEIIRRSSAALPTQIPNYRMLGR